MIRSVLLLTGLLLIPLPASGQTPSFQEGELTLSIREGTSVENWRYLKKEHRMRIDVPGEHRPAKPINLINLSTGNVRILRPHNATWTEVPADRLKRHTASLFPEPPQPPAGRGARPSPPGTAGAPPPRGRPQGNPIPPPSPGRLLPPGVPPSPRGIGPQSTSDSKPFGQFAHVPGVPQLPEVPKAPAQVQLPPGIGPNSGRTRALAPGIGPQPPGAAGIPGILPGAGVPFSMPPMMPGKTVEWKLIPHKETRTLHGYPCMKYTLRIPRQGILTMWLSDASELPPFHLLMHEAPRQRGRSGWRQQWAALLREAQLFPLLTVLRTEAQNLSHADEKAGEQQTAPVEESHEIMRWEVTALSARTIEEGPGKLFTLPADFHQTEPSPF